MGAKSEISWKSRTSEGIRREIYVRPVGTEWRFFTREKRFENWQLMAQPPLEDWLALLDAIKRRVARRRLRPEEVTRLQDRMRELFPDAKI